MKNLKSGESKLIIIIIAYITLCLSTLFHEWGHSVAAYLFGIKDHPFAIHYSFRPFLLGISENVNYVKVALLPHWQAVSIAAAGPFVNLILILICLFLLILFRKKIFSWAQLTIYCFYFWNVSEFFNYLFIRNIFLRDDMLHMVQFGMPHWILLIFGIVTSLLFVILLFKLVNGLLFDAFQLDNQTRLSVSFKIIAIFLITQGVTLYNSFFMY